MATTYKLIEAQTLTSNQATVTFTAIPATYTDLVFQISARNSSTFDYGGIAIAFNGSGSNSFTNINASSSSVTSNTNDYDFASSPGSAMTANTFGTLEIYISNYNSTANKPMKSMQARENNSSTLYRLGAGGLSSTYSSINSVTFTDSNAYNFITGSSFYLYGISNA